MENIFKREMNAQKHCTRKRKSVNKTIIITKAFSRYVNSYKQIKEHASKIKKNDNILTLGRKQPAHELSRCFFTRQLSHKRRTRLN